MLFCFRWRTFGLPSGEDSVKFCALFDRAGELEGTSDVPKGAGLEGRREASYAIDVPAKQNGLKKRFSSSAMQQSQGIGYADIAEVRTVTGAATCNQLLVEGWVLLGVVPLTRVGEMGARQPGDREQDKWIEDTQRYVRRLVGYVVGKRRE